MQSGNSSTSNDERYLDIALLLAAMGRGLVEPNPMVGCVIVRDDRVISSGFHERFGEPHAEANALARCAESPEGATVYVNLEPCCHTGKQTPPCVPRLIEAKVARVVIGCLDPNPAVAGNGVEELRSAGIEVVVGMREAESKQLNAPFFAVQREQRPYVTLKWAETADGKVAGPGGRRMQISGPESHRVNHRLRARFDAILVGVQTAIVDDPMLITRGVEPHRPLARIILDSSLRLPPASRLAKTARDHATHLFSVERGNDPDFMQRAAALRDSGIHLHSMPGDADHKVALAEVLRVLAGELRATHLMVEGGPTIHRAFVRENLADRALIFRARMKIESTDAPRAAPLPGDFVETLTSPVGRDWFTEYLNHLSPVFFKSNVSEDTWRVV